MHSIQLENVRCLLPFTYMYVGVYSRTTPLTWYSLQELHVERQAEKICGKPHPETAKG